MHDILSLDISKKFTWELTITNQIEKDMGFEFGVVQHPINESIKEFNDSYFGKDDTTRSKQFGVFDDQNKAVGSHVTDGWTEGDKSPVILKRKK